MNMNIEVRTDKVNKSFSKMNEGTVIVYDGKIAIFQGCLLTMNEVILIGLDSNCIKNNFNCIDIYEIEVVRTTIYNND